MLLCKLHEAGDSLLFITGRWERKILDHEMVTSRVWLLYAPRQVALAMAPPVLWKDSEGHEFLNKLVKKLIPAWHNGLREQQDDVLGFILDGEDVFYSTATGGGKTAAIVVPVLVHWELKQNGHLYPSTPQTRIREKPVGLVVTPTKGLADNLVRNTSFYSITVL